METQDGTLFLGAGGINYFNPTILNEQKLIPKQFFWILLIDGKVMNWQLLDDSVL